MIDAHAHLAYSFTPDVIDVVIENFKNKGGEIIIDTATESKELPNIKMIIDKYPEIYTVVGLHPELATTANVKEEINVLQNFVKDNIKVVGIGETGLDYLFAKNEKEILNQKALLALHIDMAKQFELPLVIHARGKDYSDYSPYYDVLEIIKSHNFKNGVYFHSYAGDMKFADIVTKLGYVIGVNGISTYSNAKELAEIIKQTPIENILLETDTPYLIPSNMDRNELLDKKINEPISVFFVAKRIAKLKGLELGNILRQTNVNTRKFFERIL